MSKILILINGHLCNNPRTQKEAEIIAKNQHQVIVKGIWFDSEFAKRDIEISKNKNWKFEPIVDIRPQRKWQNFQLRLQTKIAREQYKKWKNFNPALLGYGIKKMLRSTLNTNADLTIVHSEAGLWIANELLDKGLKVGIDFEDWFSQDLLPSARITRPIELLKKLESRLAKESQYCITTSDVMGKAISNEYNSPNLTTIYNTFPDRERQQIDRQIKDRKDKTIPSLHWFSQTIGIGRGLETLFASLPYLKTTVEIHLRGNYPEASKKILQPLIPSNWLDKIFIHPTVSNDRLLSRIAEHDIGLALEQPDIISRNFTITNKFFQYLQGGLTIIATDTLGQKEILSQYPTLGTIIPSNNPIALAKAIDNLVNNPERLNQVKNNALKVFKDNLSWENQELKILNLIDRSLSLNPQ